jgi:hypothetical protein
MTFNEASLPPPLRNAADRLGTILTAGRLPRGQGPATYEKAPPERG